MLTEYLKKYQSSFHPVVKIDLHNERLLLLHFTEANTLLTADVIDDTDRFSTYVNTTLETAGAHWGIGGYKEHRTVYSRSKVFDTAPGEEPRRLHLGVDIWGKAGTEVFVPISGTVHSVGFNNRFGDYGATIILQHQLDGKVFHSLYGHLALADLNGLSEGEQIQAGQLIAHFGEPNENGHWPPHLHFQLIIDMEGKKGDYPGVCKFSERENYLSNCPDPDAILGLMQYAK